MIKRVSAGMTFSLLIGMTGVSLAAAARVLMPMTAKPRWGNNACWVDNGGRLKNVCEGAQMISFMPEFTAPSGHTMATANIYTDAANFTMKCQQVAMSLDLTSWRVGPLYSSYNLAVRLPEFKVKSVESYSIDCWVPSGKHLGAADVFWAGGY